MYAESNDNPPPPGTAEMYAGAISSGSTRMEAHRTKPADLIAASGMSPYSTGTAIMRLVTEWNSGAVPQPAHVASAKELQRRGMSASVAHAEARRMAAQAVDWQQREHMLRFQRMKTLPTVRAALLHWVKDRGWEDAEALVAAVLQRYLSPKCPKCGGCGEVVVAGTGGRSSGKRCRAENCGGSKVLGELIIPHGGRGKALLAYIEQCKGQACRDLGASAQKLRHPLKQDYERHLQRGRIRAEQEGRVAAESRQDVDSNPAADAAHFAASMGAPRRR